jgi:hypothetical protein
VFFSIWIIVLLFWILGLEEIMGSNQEDNFNPEELFQEIKSQYRQRQDRTDLPTNSDRNNSDEPEDALEQIKSQYQQNPKQSDDSENDDPLEQFKQQYQQQKQTEWQKHQVEIRETEAERQKKEKQRKQKAQKWLDNLEPYSEEGLWFEDFARSYSSRLEAAIDYLQALGQL